MTLAAGCKTEDVCPGGTVDRDGRCLLTPADATYTDPRATDGGVTLAFDALVDGAGATSGPDTLADASTGSDGLDTTPAPDTADTTAPLSDGATSEVDGATSNTPDPGGGG